jgi:6-phosphogluconolactonase/glucosamine-6-phosphate isomerase/deaminase
MIARQQYVEDVMLIFRKTQQTAPAAGHIADTISRALAGNNRVLWLVPGGSSIAVAVEASRLLQGNDLQRLSVTLTDERFGPVGHTDSNWLQLQEAGFALPGAKLVPVLDGHDREATVRAYGQLLTRLFAEHDFKLGLFGLGADGHIAGALPASPAVSSSDMAVGYVAGVFERITMTPQAITQLDEAVVYAMGESKQPVLTQLQKELPLDQQPAQVLKKVPSVTIYNDMIGEEV